ncbi:MAG: 5-formyltetrahydrofolate cyclo-ligase [Proteobacteria bacterium]|nr:5-formyltetrahydrofolate cyclo-ligase [Pseudomonadota bacterium]
MSDPHALRRDLRARRESLSTAARMAAALVVAQRLRQLPGWDRAAHVAGYWAVRGELPLLGVLPVLPASARYCLPILHADHTLRFAPWRAGDAIAPNRFGIPEPADTHAALVPERIDIVLLPLLGYTRAGDRLGTGGGWYDRSFAFRQLAPAPPLLVGVGFACQQIDAAFTPQSWDVPLDAIVTERELVSCVRQ